MKPLCTLFLLFGVAWAQADTLPQLPTREEVLKLPAEQQLAAREAVKRVVFARLVRQKEDARRLTRENSAACVALARQLNAPQALVELLQMEAEQQLSGRLLYDHRLAFNNLVRAYGVDALQIRLFTEGMHVSDKDLREICDWLPKEHLFNLVPETPVPTEELLVQLSLLGEIYAQIDHLYKGVTDKEQADAAAQSLLDSLQSFDATAPVRKVLIDRKVPRVTAVFQQLLLPIMQQLSEQRTRLQQADFFGSRHLAALDYLLD